MSKKLLKVRIDSNSAIMQQLCNVFPDFSETTIIQSAILYALLFCYESNKRRNISKAEVRKMAQGIKSSGKGFPYRTEEKILDILGMFYSENESKKLNKADTIKCCLAEVSNLLNQTTTLNTRFQSNKNNEKSLVFLLGTLDTTLKQRNNITGLRPTDMIAYRSGIKTDKILDLILDTIDEIRKKYDIKNYYEPFMGTGNVLCHNSPFFEETLNDKSEELVNLLTILKNYPIEFIKELVSLDVNEKTFYEQKNLLSNINKKYKGKQIRAKKERIAKAVSYYYTLSLSFM